MRVLTPHLRAETPRGPGGASREELSWTQTCRPLQVPGRLQRGWLPDSSFPWARPCRSRAVSPLSFVAAVLPPFTEEGEALWGAQ